MPNVPSRSKKAGSPKGNPPSSRKKRKSGKSTSPLASTAPSIVPINFHGAFAATSKVVTAQDLGLAIGEILFIHRIRLEATSSKPDIVSVSIADLATKGDDDIIGPRSLNHLCSASTKFTMDFTNPNALLYWTVREVSDVICTINSTDPASTLTFAGTVWLRRQGSESHKIA